MRIDIPQKSKNGLFSNYINPVALLQKMKASKNMEPATPTCDECVYWFLNSFVKFFKFGYLMKTVPV